MLASLAKDAAELLWEMVATEDVGEATSEMRSNAATLQVRIREEISRVVKGKGDAKDCRRNGVCTSRVYRSCRSEGCQRQG